MNNFYTIVVIILIVCTGCISKSKTPDNEIKIEESPAVNKTTDFSEQSTWLMGYFTRERLTDPPYSEWFVKGYDEYHVDTNVVNSLKDVNKNDIIVKIVLGTWCPDSRREVPRFMHILDIWAFPPENVIFIGVDDVKDSPVAEYINLGIERVPTFIFYENNIEKGRIIENPVASLEKDMVKIITKE